MRIIILGSGRVGARLATELSGAGHEITIIDKNSVAFRRLGKDYHGQVVVGTGIDSDVLRKAGIDSADVFLALTNGDNTNLMTAQVAKKIFKINRVMARCYDPERAKAFRELGIQTICSTSIMAEQIEKEMGLI